MLEAKNIRRCLDKIKAPWSPHKVTEFNGHDIMVVKVEGEFVWHSHSDTDDFFLVLSGRLILDTEEGTVELGDGDLYVVPRGVRHRPVAPVPTELLLIERAGTLNTGDAR